MQIDHYEVRALADLVKPGECITFPNGITVDKRIAPSPVPVQPPAAPWNSPRPGCSACGLTFDGPIGYVCTRPNCPTGLGGVTC